MLFRSASLLEPAFIIINRYVAILQPYNDMHVNSFIPPRSVDAKYATVPPPLAIWRAFKTKHYFLALVCSAALSTSGLAVALGGLIHETAAMNRRSTITEDQLYSSDVWRSLTTLEADEHGQDHF